MARGENIEDFLVGLTIDAGQGSPIVEQVTDRSKRINQTTFTRGDRAVAVRWLHRYAGDTTRLTFVKDTYKNEFDFDVVNSTELRAVGFKMKEVRLPQTPAPPRHRTRSTNTTAAMPCEPNTHYLLDREGEEGILKQNW